MKKVIVFIIIFIYSFVLSQVREVRNLSNFTQIEAQKGVTVLITQSNEFKVEVESDNEEKVAKILTQVKNNELKISVDSDNVNINKNNKNCNKKKDCFKTLIVYVSLPYLEKITASSGVKMELLNTITAENFDLDISSGVSFEGNIKVENNLTIDASSGAFLASEIHAKNTTVNISSGVFCGLKGKTQNLSVDASSGAALGAEELESETCNANASSAASIQVNCSKKLNANAHNVAQVTYIGDPEINQNTSTNGSVKSKN